jgi:hypothetical protein
MRLNIRYYTILITELWSKWLRSLKHGFAAARWLKLWVRMPPDHGYLFLVTFVLSGRGLCDGQMTCPKESYRVWCVWVWSWSLGNGEALARWGLLRHNKQKNTKRSIRICFLSDQIIVSLLIYIAQGGPKVAHHRRARCWGYSRTYFLFQEKKWL